MRDSTTVVNRRVDREDVYIGRGSPFGNPFGLTGRRSRFKTVASDDPVGDYERWLRGEIGAPPGWVRPTEAQIASLRGKALGCYCKPGPCHGDVLARLAERVYRALTATATQRHGEAPRA